MSANIAKTEYTYNHKENKPLALVFFASPRKNGYTRKLLNAFLGELGDEYEVRIIDCYKLNPQPCTACGACEKSDVCTFHDLDEYDALLNRAELLVYASPVYNLSVPAPLKALMDRSQRYFSKRFSLGVRPPIKVHKRAVLLLTCGSKDESCFDIITKQLSRMFTILNSEICASVCMPNTDNNIDTEPFEQLAAVAARQVVHRVFDGEVALD